MTEEAHPRLGPGGAILLDWGTSNLRAFRVDGDGRVRDRRQSAKGILRVAAGGFPAAFQDAVGDWRAAAPGCPAVMSGMVGSRQGWREAPYLDCPAGLGDLAAGLTPVPGLGDAWIAPGVARSDGAGHHDVMRGEEVQIFGALEAPAEGRQVLCLPGTHSKWAVVEDGRLTWFATSMTGEVFAALCSHTILGRLMVEEDGGEGAQGAAFSRGLARAGEAGGLLHHLFGVRADGLFGALPGTGLKPYLSGLLIGHEVARMVEVVGAGQPLHLVGAPVLTGLYAKAIGARASKVSITDGETATVRGLVRLLSHAA